MAVPRLLPAAAGVLAILGTAALLVIHIILAQSLADPSSSARVAAIISSALEASVLVLLCLCLSTYLRCLRWSHSQKSSGVWFGLSALLCAVAAATSVAALVCLSNTAKELPNAILGTSTVSFLVGASVALGLTFAAQLVFLVVHFVLARLSSGQAHSLHTEDDGHRSSPPPHVKSIPYSQTSPMGQKSRGSTSMDSRSPPGSSGGRSATETMSSIRSSLSHVVRPISSKTRLLAGTQSSRSQRPASRRPASVDSNTYREMPSTEDGFDSWDTSAVDPQNRQTVLETSSPTPGRFLETIPASPTTSRSPSPGTPLDLEPPRTRRRSRSYSPASSRPGSQRAGFTMQSTASESHIHPLFRSDSPTPPPAVSAGTVVTAAPNAGLVISDRQSIRSLNRMRSGSLPAVPSPLSRQGSFDDFGRRVDSADVDLREELEDASNGTERKMTPPIPEWILSAGSRTSLSGYNSRKVRAEDGAPPAEGEPF